MSKEGKRTERVNEPIWLVVMVTSDGGGGYGVSRTSRKQEFGAEA